MVIRNSEVKVHSRRRILTVISGATLGLATYAFLDLQGYLGPNVPLTKYMNDGYKKELLAQADNYGENGDRVAYAVNYLNLQSHMVAQVMDSWNSLSSTIRQRFNDHVPTPTATVVADELSHPLSKPYAHQYPNLLWTHAHTNALFTFPWMHDLQEFDRRMTTLADLRLSQRTPHLASPHLDLYYPENNPNDPNYYGKRRYVREGFIFFAKHFGHRLNGMDFDDVSVISEQSTAAAVTIQYSGLLGQVPVRAGDTFILFDSGDVSLYCFSDLDNNAILGPRIPPGALSLGLTTMKQFRDRHPALENSCLLPLGRQGYIELDDVFTSDPVFTQYLRQGYFSINPTERTFAWKEYATVSLKPEQTVRGLGVAQIYDFHPANFQPLSLLQSNPEIVKLLVQSPEIYVPARWNQGFLFQPFDPQAACN